MVKVLNMLGTQPITRQPVLFSYRIELERRLAPDHLLRQVAAVLDLGFVLPMVRDCYGRSGHVSLDPRVLVKLLLLLLLYNIPSERELLEQVRVRLDFLWFLGLDLESDIPHHSVLSKARARWGKPVFEKIFIRTVEQCVQAGLVNGRLLHIDSTLVKAQASKDSVVVSGPELVQALRQAYQEQEAKLEVLPPVPQGNTAPQPNEPSPPVARLRPVEPRVLPPPQTVPVVEAVVPDPVAPPVPQVSPNESRPPAAPVAPVELRVLPPSPRDPAANPSPKDQGTKRAVAKLPVNRTHISPTDPEAELARSKNGVTELNYKEHRLVDDTHGVITAVAATTANVADGTQLPALYAQHGRTTDLPPAHVTVAGDHHYGTADNYVFCAQAGLRAHLGEASAHLEGRGHLALSQFVYESERDRLRCPQGHYLVRHQDRPEEQVKVYLIEAAAACAQCSLRDRCTKSKRGRSIRRHMHADLVAAARAEAHSPAGRYSRKRRQHVMEGSFADAVNNHGAKKARWRGLWRQQIQSWLIAAVQNLRILLRHQRAGPGRAAAAAPVGAAGGKRILQAAGAIAWFRGVFSGSWPRLVGLNHT